MVLWLLACGPARPPQPAAAEAVSWQAPLGHDHALLGRIWSPSGGFVAEEAVVTDLRTADFVLLGEKHDNPDVHRLQARLIAGVEPEAVAFEMLDHADPVAGATDPASLAAAVDWAHSGWPDFALYEPVFAAAFAVGAEIVPAHPTRDEVRAVMSGGFESLPPEALEGLRLDRVLEPDALAALEAQIVASHCGHATPDMVDKMVRAQIFKDAWMARALTHAGPRAALVAGNGHTRADRGVPRYLDGSVRVVAWVEVRDGEDDPAAYDAAADYVWFVPRVDDEDPCAAFADPSER